MCELEDSSGTLGTQIQNADLQKAMRNQVVGIISRGSKVFY
jgi:hypothetical protein